VRYAGTEQPKTTTSFAISVSISYPSVHMNNSAFSRSIMAKCYMCYEVSVISVEEIYFFLTSGKIEKYVT